MEIIKTRDMYNYYCKNINGSISAINTNLFGLNKTKQYILGNLESCREYLRQFTKIDFEKIKDLDKHIPDKYFGTSTHFKEYFEKSKNLIYLIVETNKKINNQSILLKEYESKVIDWKTFRTTLELLNKKISQEILKGYSFSMGHGISKIRIKKHFTKEGSKKRINWKESMEFKAKLLSEGKLPFKVLELDEMKRPIKDNGGEKFLIYYDDQVTYTWHWEKGACNILNHKIYAFRPTVNGNTKDGKYSLGNANILQKLARENSEQLQYILP